MIFADMKILKNNGIDILINDNIKHLDIDVYLCCDYSFLCTWLGLSPSADHFCYLCNVNRKSTAMTDFSQVCKPRNSLEKWKVGEEGVQYNPISTIIPLNRIMICSTHMFCAIFQRLLFILEGIARLFSVENSLIIDKCNEWFEKNHLYITFDKDKKFNAKITGPEMKCFLKLRLDFYTIFPSFDSNSEIWRSIEQTFQSFEWLYLVANSYEPKQTDIDNFETKATDFLNLLKEKFFSDMTNILKVR